MTFPKSFHVGLLPLLCLCLWILSAAQTGATLANAGVSGTQDWPTPSSNTVLSSTLVSSGQASVTNYSSTGFDLVVQNNGSTTANGASIRSNVAAFSSNGGLIRFLGTLPGTISYAEIRANQGIFDLTSIKLGSADNAATYPMTFTIIPLDSSFSPVAGASATSPAQAAQLTSSQDNWITFTPTGATQIANFTGIYGVRIVQNSGIQVNCDAITVNNPRLPSSPPTVTTPTAASIAGTTATLGGNVTSDGGATISERGIVYSITTANSNPQINGSSVTKVPASGTTGVFTANITGLTATTGYSFAAYATNSAGTTYTTPASTFTTLNNNASLSSLVLSAGTLSPVFAAGTTSYTATVLKASSTLTVTPTAAESHATLQVRVNGGSYASVTSGSASGSLSLNLGDNPVDVLVTAQDGTTTKTYTTTVTRWTNLQNWRNQYFSTIANSGNAADTVNPQNDGLANLLKFAMGLDPTKNVLVADGIAKSGNNLQFNYQRNIDAIGEVTFIVEWSDTLQSNDWHTTGVTESILSATSTLQQVQATVDVTGLTRRFMRLRVTDP